MRRVSITGIGLLTALGAGTSSTWRGLLEGRSAVGPIRGFDASTLRTRIGAEILDFEPQVYIPNRRTLRMMSRNDRLALSGAVLAVEDAGLDLTQADGDRVGVFTGCNKEVADPMYIRDSALAALGTDGRVEQGRFGEAAQSAFYPLFYVEGLQAASLFYISQAFNAKGANAFFAGGADAGATAIGRAYRAIRRGEVDVAIAGGFDDAVWWWNLSRYDRMGVMTERNDLGAAACRPFDRDRSGTIFGEGAAMLVLEERDRAVSRGARTYSEIAGFGSAHDAHRLMRPHPNGRGLALALHSALREAGSNPCDVAYVATHGDGTRLGDLSEMAALQSVFGSSDTSPMASSVKPATGHLMGGAGGLNVAVAALTLQQRMAPPTLNLQTLERACGVDFVVDEPKEIHGSQALAIARGCEGQNVALTLRAAE